MTVCVTLWALLELYKEGEVRWQQERPFSEILITSTQVLDTFCGFYTPGSHAY